MGVTKVTWVTSDDLLPKYDHGPTSIILGRNLVQRKKTKPETKKKSKLLKTIDKMLSKYQLVRGD